MAKTFAPRVSKKRRKTIDLTENLDIDTFRISDEMLLKGARLDEISLSDIIVKDQVRTKFSDASIRELSKNIEQNGLIQPLVLHRVGDRYTLVCGERRYRAMKLINMEKSPCFVLDGKSQKELMAIQFSENSSREALHYIDRADGILNYQRATKASERKIQAALGISKSEVHRSLIIAKLPEEIKDAAKVHNIEKYVLVEYDVLSDESFKEEIRQRILTGDITKRARLRKLVREAHKDVDSVSDVKRKRKSSTKQLSSTISANAFIKALQSKAGGVDKETRNLLKSLVEETKEIVDL
ncbi:MAG: ParB/RepB/Spo0J family partition protein [Bacteriovoracaceae bacterium]|nr:ParB/RepB/Spo0J family partition protein [Bacteriovoracaceae bacterium]